MDMVSVGIKRNAAHTIQRECPEWEIPVLQELHGETSVLLGERKPIPKEEVPDVFTAYEKLIGRYGTNDGTAALNTVYRTFDDFKRAYTRKN